MSEWTRHFLMKFPAAPSKFQTCEGETQTQKKKDEIPKINEQQLFLSSWRNRVDSHSKRVPI